MMSFMFVIFMQEQLPQTLSVSPAAANVFRQDSHILSASRTVSDSSLEADSFP